MTVREGGILLVSAELSAAELLQGFQAILHRWISAMDFIKAISRVVAFCYLPDLIRFFWVINQNPLLLKFP
jgi:hypothetical protein